VFDPPFEQYASNGYFTSKNCMRELISATKLTKPILALLDPDTTRGGMSRSAVHAALLMAQGSYERWEFDVAESPSGQVLFDHLMDNEPIEWARIGHFQGASRHPTSCSTVIHAHPAALGRVSVRQTSRA
jgi:hypothetical protein